MSHFSVAVFTEPNGKTLAELLQPYHEFECDGISDEYVQNINQLEEAEKEYKKYTVSKLKSPNGVLFETYDDKFYREPTPEEQKNIGFGGTGCGNGILWTSKDWNDGRGYRTKVHYIPTGYQEIEVKAFDVMSLKKFIDYYYDRPTITEYDTPDIQNEHKYGWVKVNDQGEVVELVNRTNPNHKWDYWRIGGRYRGIVKAANGNFGDKTWEIKKEDKNNCFDNAKIRDLIFTPDKEEYNKAIRFWEIAIENQPLKKDEDKDDFIHLWKTEYYLDRYKTKENYARLCSSFVTYAVVTPDGKWYQKGEMGWWGASSETGDESLDWDIHYKERFLDRAYPDWELTVVDCHT